MPLANPKDPRYLLVPQDDGTLHIRLCHFCLKLTESTLPVLECDHCHQDFAPSEQNLDELLDEVFEEEEEASELPQKRPDEFYGLWVLW